MAQSMSQSAAQACVALYHQKEVVLRILLIRALQIQSRQQLSQGCPSHSAPQPAWHLEIRSDPRSCHGEADGDCGCSKLLQLPVAHISDLLYAQRQPLGDVPASVQLERSERHAMLRQSSAAPGTMGAGSGGTLGNLPCSESLASASACGPKNGKLPWPALPAARLPKGCRLAG